MVAKQEQDTEQLIEAVRKLHKDYLDLITPKKRFWREFSGGVVRGLGIAIGGTIIFGILAFVLGKFLIVPGVQEMYDKIRTDATELQQGFRP